MFSSGELLFTRNTSMVQFHCFRSHLHSVYVDNISCTPFLVLKCIFVIWLSNYMFSGACYSHSFVINTPHPKKKKITCIFVKIYWVAGSHLFVFFLV